VTGAGTFACGIDGAGEGAGLAVSVSGDGISGRASAFDGAVDATTGVGGTAGSVGGAFASPGGGVATADVLGSTAAVVVVGTRLDAFGATGGVAGAGGGPGTVEVADAKRRGTARRGGEAILGVAAADARAPATAVDCFGRPESALSLHDSAANTVRRLDPAGVPRRMVSAIIETACSASEATSETGLMSRSMRRRLARRFRRRAARVVDVTLLGSSGR
jgi:hypothetical protein